MGTSEWNDQTRIERLETERLTLRMFRESDLDDYAEMCAMPM